MKVHPPFSNTHWLALSLLPGLGPARLARLRTYLDNLSSPLSDWEDVLDEDVFLALKWPPEAAKAAFQYLCSGRLPEQSEIKLDRTLSWLDASIHRCVLTAGSKEYPPLLSQIPAAPALLYVEGEVLNLHQQSIGIVGARKSSAYGRQIAFQYGCQLSEMGLTVVSGGAVGIDSAAHQGAVAAGSPTVVVMGTGLLNLYPKVNQALFNQILDQGGTVVSEYPLDTKASPSRFPPRNRIISGLSRGILVVEAAVRSGSLISASYAIQQNREVFAIPGRVTDKQSLGCLTLIQQGACLVSSPEQILEELSLKPQMVIDTQTSSNASHPCVDVPVQPRIPISETGLEILRLMDAGRPPDQAMPSFSFDLLLSELPCSVPDLMQALVELEIAVCIESTELGYRRCVERNLN